MDNSFVEEVAASLVREFLSRKGLKKTISTMDRELPRSALSINNRNELRNVLHLHSLYKQNKAKENPLKTLLEIITNYFLEHRVTSRSTSSSSALSASQTKSSASHPPDLSDEDRACGNASLPHDSKTQASRHDVENPPDKFLQSRKHQHKSEKCHAGTICNSLLTPDGDKKLKGSQEDLKSAVISEELQAMDLQKRKSKRSTSISSTAPLKGEKHDGNDLNAPKVDSQENKGSSAQVNPEIASRTLSSSHVPKISNDTSRCGGLRRENPSPAEAVVEARKSPTSTWNKEDQMKDTLELVDVEDEATTGEVNRNLNLSTLHMLQEASKAIDISLAKGGPCGVLAAVQACVLQQLIFGDSNRNKDARPSGRQQFTPIGKYKADGILETLILHSATRYEDLIVLLQQNIQQFEIGPCGCILLTVSVILSRSINLDSQGGAESESFLHVSNSISVTVS
ncbi:hypothetical protein CIB84_001297 [Bambusicola thoracicus]|uniref:Ubiquitin carboxyl-terminal hydrolase MINDY n=1 Tax=Bambusicola thoracicus TaxID=9083 RepID=A0A2P4TF04_BAMTH|nr:hypothetical protein CIB84_001297 [Bambusicola thoracicus]